jgi:hypothetical protein
MSSAAPEAAFNQNPNIMIGENRRSSRVGMPGAIPRRWMAMATLTPTASAMPMAWADRMAGNARMDVDSRVHTLSGVDSIHRNSGSMRANCNVEVHCV